MFWGSRRGVRTDNDSIMHWRAISKHLPCNKFHWFSSFNLQTYLGLLCDAFAARSFFNWSIYSCIEPDSFSVINAYNLEFCGCFLVNVVWQACDYDSISSICNTGYLSKSIVRLTCCASAAVRIWKRCDNLFYQSRGFKASRDFTIYNLHN